MTSKTSICLHCAASLPTARARKFIRCQACGFSVDKVTYQIAVRTAYRAIRYGRFYRDFYENGPDVSKHWYRAAISVPDVFAFVGLAVLSGIIGNASYDSVKSALKRIRVEWTERLKPDDISRILRIETDEEEYERCKAQLNEFLNGMQNVSPAVRIAILEELLAHETAEILVGPKRLTPAQLKERLGEVVALARRGQPTRPEAGLFKNAWSTVPLGTVSPAPRPVPTKSSPAARRAAVPKGRKPSAKRR